MQQAICRYILYHLLGWEKTDTTSLPNKAILCVAPHTSNWDFIIGLLYSRAEGFKSNFLMKKEWFFWPLGGLFRHLGGIPVYRSKHTSMTDRLAEDIQKADRCLLCITPEGTRSRNAEWKKGFYFIALKAQIPIKLYALDYKKKAIISTRNINPSGDVDKDLTEIKQYYKNIHAKHPANFTIGEDVYD